MWPPGALSAEPLGARKDGCGWMLRERLIRPAVDLWRRLASRMGCGSRELLLADDRQHCAAGLLSIRTSIVTARRRKTRRKSKKPGSVCMSQLFVVKPFRIRVDSRLDWVAASSTLRSNSLRLQFEDKGLGHDQLFRRISQCHVGMSFLEFSVLNEL